MFPCAFLKLWSQQKKNLAQVLRTIVCMILKEAAVVDRINEAIYDSLTKPYVFLCAILNLWSQE